MKLSSLVSISLGTFLLLPLAGVCADGKPLKVGVAWEGKSSMADRTLKGFQEAMATLAPQAQIEVQKELKDPAALGETLKKFEQDKSAIVALRSTGAKALAKAQPAIPGYFGACNDPVQLGVLKSASAPEGNLTGVTYSLPYDQQLQSFLGILPKAKRVLLIFEQGHPSGPLDQAGVKAACEKLQLTYAEKGVKTKEEAAAAFKEAETSADMVLLGAQALLIDNGGALASASKAPAFSLTEKPVADGALGGLVANDVKLGQMLAESVVDVLVKGKKVGEVAVKTDPKPELLINVATAKRLGLEIPFEILQAAKILGQ